MKKSTPKNDKKPLKKVMKISDKSAKGLKGGRAPSISGDTIKAPH